ncbi:MAG: UDP-3-O-[3-hydroxymyristoyl] glucosamine N-acyltransferase [Salibacteraceae bacterium]|jgi:UDP-3-O-[3-hydroxymyristoyl] glucosamine N-acyltransferase
MEFSAGQLAGLLEGNLEGDSEIILNDLTQIEKGKQGSVCFLSDMKYAEFLYETAASAAIVANDFVPEKQLPSTLSLIRVENPRLSVGKILEVYHQFKNSKTGIHKTAVLEDSATIGANVFIGANVYVGENSVIGDNSRLKAGVSVGNNVKIGSDTHLHFNVTVEDDSIIGNHCVFQPGSVIGSEGFGFQPNSDNNYQKLYHIGNVVIEDYVEIGANTTVDRGTIGSTTIRKGVKLDNLIQVGHNVEIGENTVAAALTGLSGSTILGKNCMIGGQSGFAGHQKIADGFKLAAQSGVLGDVKEENQIHQGAPSFKVMDYKKAYVYFKKLPELVKEINNLKKEIKNLKS